MEWLGGEKIGKGKGGGRSPNDQRSDAMNPNNPEYQDAQDNRSGQLDPESDTYRSSRDLDKDEDEDEEE